MLEVINANSKRATQIDFDALLVKAKDVFRLQATQVEKVGKSLDEKLCRAIATLLNCEGKVVLTGIGKSGIISRKIAATMSSMGTLAVYLHPVEAMHGDLGIIAKEDVILALSNSGNTDEIINLLPILKKIGVKIIALVGNADSKLAKEADIFIEAKVEREVDANNLAPTCSSTVFLVLGDTLATLLALIKGFQPQDFALYHPGGVLGRRLLLNVEDLMHSGTDNPVLEKGSSMEEVISELTSKRLGGVSVVEEGKLIGIITDGDLKRILKSKKEHFFKLRAENVMTRNPITIKLGEKAVKALELMEHREHQIGVLPVIDEQRRVRGMLRLHDLIEVGLRFDER